jgi:hypothetical protein
MSFAIGAESGKESTITVRDLAKHIIVVEIMRPFQPLADKVNTLAVEVTEHRQQQQAHVKKDALGESSSDHSILSLPHCRRLPHEDDDDGGDFLPTYHKLDFPKFDGSGDSLPWLNRCEHYFRIHHTPEHK